MPYHPAIFPVVEIKMLFPFIDSTVYQPPSGSLFGCWVIIRKLFFHNRISFSLPKALWIGSGLLRISVAMKNFEKTLSNLMKLFGAPMLPEIVSFNRKLNRCINSYPYRFPSLFAGLPYWHRFCYPDCFFIKRRMNTP